MSDRQCVLLIRGINVGGAKRVSMADLRALMESLGCTQVKTLLNSGNAVFTRAPGSNGNEASRIEAGLQSRLGVTARVVVLPRKDLDLIVKENALVHRADDPARLQVVVAMDRKVLDQLHALQAQSWGEEALHVGSKAAYLWCPQGVIKSALFKSVDRALGDSATARNWATVQKLKALLE